MADPRLRLRKDHLSWIILSELLSELKILISNLIPMLKKTRLPTMAIRLWSILFNPTPCIALIVAG